MRVLLAVLLLWSGWATAQTRVNVVHDSSIPKYLARSLVRIATVRIRRDTGLHIRVASFKAIRKLPEFAAYPYGAAPFYKNLLQPRRPTVLLVPIYLYAGQAPVCGDFVVSSVVPWAFGSFPYPKEYFEGSARTLEHELGHMLGASHTADGSVMDPGGAGGARFSPSSVEEIYQCQMKQS